MVLYLAARAIALLVERARFVLRRFQRRHDEARIGASGKQDGRRGGDRFGLAGLLRFLLLPALRRVVSLGEGRRHPFGFADHATFAAPLSSVRYLKSLNRRAGLAVATLASAAAARSAAISTFSREFCARPNKNSTSLVSHQAISSSRAKPESARRMMRTFGQRARIRAITRAISSAAPALASMSALRNLATRSWSPQKTYNGR